MSLKDTYKEKYGVKLTDLEEVKLKKLKKKNYLTAIDEYECLKIKFLHNDYMEKHEIIELVLYCKYAIHYGKMEMTKMSALKFYEKYFKRYEL